MPSKVINISLTVDSIDLAINEIERYDNWLQEKTEELARRLAELGAGEARITFANAEYLGDNDVEVDVVATDDGYSIIASGTAVIFIEFGSGVEATHPQGNDFGYTEGSWSASDKGRGLYAENGRWWYDGVPLTGQPPAMAMFKAAENLKDQLKRIAKEIFSQ